MKAVIAGLGTAVAASACCIGPVVFTLIGAGTLGAASLALVSYRPWFIGLTAVILGFGFFSAYRPTTNECSADGACSPYSRRRQRFLMWVTAGVAALLVTFPYWIGWFVS